MIMSALGLMSGTSMDGIDLALLVTDGENEVARGPSRFEPYDAAFRRRIEQGLAAAASLADRADRPGDLAPLERELTLRHADAVSRFVSDLPPHWPSPTVIGFHGQTVLHRPERGLTVQLGDGRLLASRTGLPVIFDMRANDMAHGGQGAPLVPAYHAALARQLAPESFPVAFVNIGGISNVTWVPAKGDPVAFDSGPGNALIDRWVQAEGGVPFDADGAIASEGGVAAAVVEAYLNLPFFDRPAPKSLDRLDFTLDLAASLDLADGARTLAAVAAGAIVRAAEKMPSAPKSWIVGGGGRKNPHIMADLHHALSPVALMMAAEEAGFDGDAMEAEAWAYLAVRAHRGFPLTWPTTTGCREPVSGGVKAMP